MAKFIEIKSVIKKKIVDIRRCPPVNIANFIFCYGKHKKSLEKKLKYKVHYAITH